MTTQSTVTTTTGGTQKYGVDNLTYDLVACLYEKSKGLEAYSQYVKDAQGNQQASELFQRMQEQDRKCIQDLQKCLQGTLSSR